MTAMYWPTVPIVAARAHFTDLIDRAFTEDVPIIDETAGLVIVPEVVLVEQFAHGADLAAFAGPAALVITRSDGRTASVWPFVLDPEGGYS